MSLLPEFVYQGVLPDCFSKITNWFLLLADLSSLLATNSCFSVFQPLSGTVLSHWAGPGCFLYLLIPWPLPCWYCCFIPYLSPGSVPFACSPIALCHFALLWFPNLILTIPEKCILFKWDNSGLTLNCARTWGLDLQNVELLSELLLWRTEPIMLSNFPTFALVWAVSASSPACL